MSSSNKSPKGLEQQLLALQQEVEDLRLKNTDLEEQLKAYSLISTGQTSLINKLIDKVPFGVMLINQDSIVIHANVAAGKIFETELSNMKGQHCNQFFECYDECGNCPATTSKNKEVNLKPIRCVDHNKHVMHSAFVSNEGSEKIVVETFIDITEIKQAEEELLKINKTKDEFLGMISHELRTPLNVIQGYSSLLEEELSNVDNVDVSEYVENIQHSGEMLLQLVNNLLELSNLTAGKVQADNIPIEIQMIVTQLQYRLEKTYEKNHNKLIINAEDIPPFEQDLALLMKVLYELLINANKFTENGEVTLSITLQKKDGADWISFKVSDTGCGMTEGTMNQIFSAFHQADSSLTRSHEGLGLGLSIVEKIVKIINGYIEVESELGKGSSFAILLPYDALI
ncbi:MAG TPA: PAS domain-containing sensor histidine kinase [Gammaproteobacteria bacterium]|nr:PAS domain-containing sensor histidine kinase [Gammaproteobacteria bacterium]